MSDLNGWPQKIVDYIFWQKKNQISYYFDFLTSKNLYQVVRS